MATPEYGGDQLHLNRVLPTLCKDSCEWDASAILRTLYKIARTTAASCGERILFIGLMKGKIQWVV
ncbi:hypothetical protein A7K50_13295 [Dehalobacter sp. MCB1]|nr:hypothetical protein A7K50_13295 [Dehalobacter sp. MCB1]TCX49938.1 hypothetical protein C1I36_08900 [Dehalobacter sp. 14DCB1]TCX54204.1 hypothetical protein C1I38_05435 [Dehalobacter sp. 12DCB1]